MSHRSRPAHLAAALPPPEPDPSDAAGEPATVRELGTPRDLVGVLLDQAAARPTSPTLALAHGRRVVVEGSARAPADTVEIRGPGGEIELAITITPEGPRLRVRAATLELDATEAIRMRCEVFELAAARAVAITAARGDVTIDAGDDVVIVGERVRLN